MKSIKYLTAIALTGLLAVTAFADEKKDQKQNPIKQTIEQTIEQKYWETEKLIDQSSSCDIFNITLEGELSCMVCGPDKGPDYICPPGGSRHSYYLNDITNISDLNIAMNVRTVSEKFTYLFPTPTAAAAAASQLKNLVKDYKKPNSVEQARREAEKLLDQSSSCDVFSINKEGEDREGELSCMVCGPDNGLDYFCPPEGSWHSYYLCDITDVSAFNESVTVKIIKNRDYHTPNKEDYSYVFPTKDLAVEAASKLEILAKVYSAKNCK